MQNKISKLHTNSGDMLEEYQDISKEPTHHYSQLLSETNHNRLEEINKVTHCILPLVNNDHNHSLMQPVSLQEVEVGMEQMADDTSLGLDGFTIDFFHHCWDLLKDEVLEIIEESRKKNGSFQL